MSDTCKISLIYRGVLGNRGVGISADSYAKTWTLHLVNHVWTLLDHNGEEVYSFSQKAFYRKVAFPGSLPGNKDLRFLELDGKIHCFQPEQEVLEVLKPYVEQSERANAPQLAKWHRLVGLGFLIFGSLCLAAGIGALYTELQNNSVLGLLMHPVALTLIPSGLIVGGYVLIVGIRELLRARHFARIALAREQPDL